MNVGAIIQAIIAVIAYIFGYPFGGTAFILIMTPLVIYMVIKQDARFFPALIIHCASDTSVMYLTFILMIIICILKSKALFANKHTRILTLLLLLTLPVYLLLLYQKSFLDGLSWQGSLGHSCFYLSFWAFLFGYLIYDTYNIKVGRLLFFSFLFLYTVIRVFPFVTHGSRVISMIVPMGATMGLYLLKYSERIVGTSLFVVSLIVFFLVGERTLSEFFSLLYSIILFLIISNGKEHLVKGFVGWKPYIVIAILMIYGIMNFRTIQYGEYADHIDFSSWTGFWNRVQYKFFDDRAVFWDASWNQLVLLRPWLPMHDIPNISVVTNTGNRIDDIEFGAHNTPLQLLRIFGFLMGSTLILIYIYITKLTSGYLKEKNMESLLIPIVVVAIANNIISFLTGTMTMLPNYALFGFGFMGLAYGKAYFSENNNKPTMF